MHVPLHKLVTIYPADTKSVNLRTGGSAKHGSGLNHALRPVSAGIFTQPPERRSPAPRMASLGLLSENLSANRFQG